MIIEVSKAYRGYKYSESITHRHRDIFGNQQEEGINEKDVFTHNKIDDALVDKA